MARGRPRKKPVIEDPDNLFDPAETPSETPVSVEMPESEEETPKEDKKTLTSNFERSLRLPGGIIIDPGKSVEIEDWEKLKNHAVVKQWLEKGILS